MLTQMIGNAPCNKAFRGASNEVGSPATRVGEIGAMLPQIKDAVWALHENIKALGAAIAPICHGPGKELEETAKRGPARTEIGDALANIFVGVKDAHQEVSDIRDRLEL